MNNIKALMKVELMYMFDFRSIKSGKAAKKHRAALLVYIIMVPTIVIMSAGFSYMMVYGLGEMNGAHLVLPTMAAASCVTTFLTNLYRPSGTLFKAKYNDLLFSMPIKLSTIVAARLSNIYIFSAIIDALIMIPAAVVYAIYAAPGALFYVNFIICLIALPFIPIAIAATIGTLISAIVSRFRFKNLLTTLLSIAAMMVYFVFIFNFNSRTYDDAAMAQMIGTFTSQLSRLYPPITLFSHAIVDESFLYMLLFAGVSLGVAALFCFVLSKFYLQISSRMNSTAKRKVKVDIKAGKTNSVRSALFKRELKRYFSIPIYVLNTFIGMAMVVLLTAAIAITGSEALTALLEIEGAAETVAALLPFIMGFCITMTTSSSSSISLEGKRLWILRSSPVSAWDIFIAKILTNLALTASISLVCSIILALKFQLSGLPLILMLVTPLAYCAFTSVFGLFANLHFPKMEWSNETQVVKQSTSVLIAILVGMALSMVPLFVSFTGIISSVTLQAIITALLIIITAAICLYLPRRGRVLWEEI